MRKLNTPGFFFFRYMKFHFHYIHKRFVSDDSNLPMERPQQYCPGIRCMTGKQCIPTKRQCDKYVDCMNAEDEQNCDYTGSQYQVNFYRSRNTDHSNLRYSKLKSAEDLDKLTNMSTTTAGPRSTATTFRNKNVTTSSNATTSNTITASNAITSYITTASYTTTSNATTTISSRNKEVQVETETAIDIKVKNNKMGTNDTILDAIRQLFDNQFSEETFSCGR